MWRRISLPGQRGGLNLYSQLVTRNTDLDMIWMGSQPLTSPKVAAAGHLRFLLVKLEYRPDRPRQPCPLRLHRLQGSPYLRPAQGELYFAYKLKNKVQMTIPVCPAPGWLLLYINPLALPFSLYTPDSEYLWWTTVRGLYGG